MYFLYRRCSACSGSSQWSWCRQCQCTGCRDIWRRRDGDALRVWWCASCEAPKNRGMPLSGQLTRYSLVKGERIVRYASSSRLISSVTAQGVLVITQFFIRSNLPVGETGVSTNGNRNADRGHTWASVPQSDLYGDFWKFCWKRDHVLLNFPSKLRRNCTSDRVPNKTGMK